ncbi:hypothetical protein Pcinc_040998 [Petrolisthes cinctipes]|uniref:Uncharacterized protein n=1 Tax=Petrolisthes cinctipes TaxID=88211 RepID=A0AAE1BN35_PETCI|nr:hypothetical protein Pcinc_040998 [Petrolisthes cinctipes]
MSFGVARKEDGSGRQTDRGEEGAGRSGEAGKRKDESGEREGEMEGGGSHSTFRYSPPHSTSIHPSIPRYHLTRPSIHPSHVPSTSLPLPTPPPPHVDGSRLRHPPTSSPHPLIFQASTHYPPLPLPQSTVVLGDRPW